MYKLMISNWVYVAPLSSTVLPETNFTEIVNAVNIFLGFCPNFFETKVIAVVKYDILMSIPVEQPL